MIAKYTLLFIFTFTLALAKEPQPDHLIFDGLLKKYVKGDRVDYTSFLADRKELQLYLKQFDSVIINNLSKNEQLVLFINAYNAFTIDLILENYSKTLKSIKDIKTPWDLKYCTIGRAMYSLNEIENKFLREIFKEPRIHFVINCASISCPPLPSHAFFADKIDSQLTEATTNFMKNPIGVKVNKEKLEISAIFNWFNADFESKELKTISFIISYLPLEVQKKLPDLNKILVTYQEYNWNLNDFKK